MIDLSVREEEKLTLNNLKIEAKEIDLMQAVSNLPFIERAELTFIAEGISEGMHNSSNAETQEHYYAQCRKEGVMPSSLLKLRYDGIVSYRLESTESPIETGVSRTRALPLYLKGGKYEQIKIRTELLHDHGERRQGKDKVSPFVALLQGAIVGREYALSDAQISFAPFNGESPWRIQYGSTAHLTRGRETNTIRLNEWQAAYPYISLQSKELVKEWFDAQKEFCRKL